MAFKHKLKAMSSKIISAASKGCLKCMQCCKGVKMDKNTMLIGVAVIAIVIIGVLIFGDSGKGFNMPTIFGISENKIAQNVIDYINNNQLSSTPASLVKVSKESGLVKVRLKIGESEFDSYATKDGKFLFPQAFDMSINKNAPANQNGNTGASETPKDIVKSDSPVLEAYVVSRCPYGLQMQRAMAEAIKENSSVGQYIKVRYMGSVSGNTITAMHGDAEAQENLRQICIREEQPSKYWAYVGCQMKASGKEVSCEQSTGVDSAKLSACISNSDRGVAYAKEDFDLNAKYDVQGSPTLILNGVQVSESSYGGRSSEGVKNMVCAGFNTKAGFCSTTLNTAEAAVSFSATYSSASGNAGADANCAPAQ